MGGNALAAQGAERVDKKTYNHLKMEILNRLYSITGYYGWVEIPSYSSKDTFGDLDILFTNRDKDTFDTVLKLFGNPASFHNTDVLSFLYKNLQVDLISMAPEDYHTAKIYYSYNDLGNLMGKIYHKFGLKYGHRGLVMQLRDEDNSSHKFSEIIISKNPDKIFRFIGLSYSRFLQGFSTLTEIFQFVIDSPFFDPDIFSFENMNNAARVRDKKRSTYNAFLEYIKDLDKIPRPKWGEDKSIYLDSIFSFFPEAYKTYQEELDKFKEHKSQQEKFNGAKVREWLEIAYPKEVPEGVEFGHFMKWVIYNKIGDEFTKSVWIKSNSEDSMRFHIIDWYKQWKNLPILFNLSPHNMV